MIARSTGPSTGSVVPAPSDSAVRAASGSASSRWTVRPRAVSASAAEVPISPVPTTTAVRMAGRSPHHDSRQVPEPSGSTRAPSSLIRCAEVPTCRPATTTAAPGSAPAPATEAARPPSHTVHTPHPGNPTTPAPNPGRLAARAGPDGQAAARTPDIGHPASDTGHRTSDSGCTDIRTSGHTGNPHAARSGTRQATRERRGCAWTISSAAGPGRRNRPPYRPTRRPWTPSWCTPRARCAAAGPPSRSLPTDDCA